MNFYLNTYNNNYSENKLKNCDTYSKQKINSYREKNSKKCVTATAAATTTNFFT